MGLYYAEAGLEVSLALQVVVDALGGSVAVKMQYRPSVVEALRLVVESEPLAESDKAVAD